MRRRSALIFLISLLVLSISVPFAAGQSAYQIIVSPTEVQPDSIIEVTLIGWDSNPGGGVLAGSPVAICVQQGNGEFGVNALVPVWNDATGAPTDWVKTGVNTWKRSYWAASGFVGFGENILTVRSGPYATDYIAETTFTVVSGNTPPVGTHPTDLTIPIAIGAGGAVTAGGAVGVNQMMKRRKNRTAKNKREVGVDTGISYEQPPEVFVQNWDPPVDPPEKPNREEVLIQWTLTPDYVKQAWQDLEICTQNAKDLQAQIEALEPIYEHARKVLISNILKATIKLGVQTTEIITNGVQSVYIDELRAAQSAAQLTNDFARARMIGESLSEVEKYSGLIVKAQQARQVAAQSAVQLRELIGQWDRKIAGHTAGFFSADAIGFEDDVLKNLDPATKSYLGGNTAPRTIFNRYLGGSEIGTRPGGGYDEAVRISLKEALKKALSDMQGATAELDAAQIGLKSALATANMMLEAVGKGVSSGLSSVANLADKTFGQAPSLGGLDADDPAILAEGQGYLQRLQNRISWLQRNLQIAVNCVEESRGIIKGYSELQHQEEEKTVENKSGGNSDNEEIAE